MPGPVSVAAPFPWPWDIDGDLSEHLTFRDFVICQYIAADASQMHVPKTMGTPTASMSLRPLQSSHDHVMTMTCESVSVLVVLSVVVLS